MNNVIVVGILCATVYGLFELLIRKKERLAFIEKLSEGKSFGQIEGKFNLSFGNSFWGLRGGCLLAGLGLGLIMGLIITQSNNINDSTAESVAYGGSILFLGGLGLLIAFILELKLSKKKEQE